MNLKILLRSVLLPTFQFSCSKSSSIGMNRTFAFVYDKLNHPPNDLSQATTFFCYNFWNGSNLRICNSVALWILLMAAKKQVNRFLDSICFCSHVHWQELPTTSDSANCARFSKSVTASGTSNDNSTVKFFWKVLLLKFNFSKGTTFC